MSLVAKEEDYDYTYARPMAPVEQTDISQMNQSAEPPCLKSSEESRANNVVLCHSCCLDETVVDIPTGKLTSRCLKTREVCEPCVRLHVNTQIAKNGRYEDIPCICMPGCTEVMSHEDLKGYLNARTSHIRDNGLLRKALAADPRFRWCMRPGCGSGQIHIDGDDCPIMKCHVCGFKTCFTHRCEWHSEQTCTQYTAKRSEEAAEALMRKTGKFKPCPKCKVIIEKDGGCDHMTCWIDYGGCGAEFCWVCLASYTDSERDEDTGIMVHDASCIHFVREE